MPRHREYSDNLSMYSAVQYGTIQRHTIPEEQHCTRARYKRNVIRIVPGRWSSPPRIRQTKKKENNTRRPTVGGDYSIQAHISCIRVLMVCDAWSCVLHPKRCCLVSFWHNRKLFNQTHFSPGKPFVIWYQDLRKIAAAPEPLWSPGIGNPPNKCLCHCPRQEVSGNKD